MASFFCPAPHSFWEITVDNLYGWFGFAVSFSNNTKNIELQTLFKESSTLIF
jgi:hypothetical protein